MAGNERPAAGGAPVAEGGRAMSKERRFLLQGDIHVFDRHLRHFIEQYRPAKPIVVRHISGDLKAIVKRVGLAQWLPSNEQLIEEITNYGHSLTNVLPETAGIDTVMNSAMRGFYVPTEVQDALHRAVRHYSVQAVLELPNESELGIDLASVNAIAVLGGNIQITLRPYPFGVDTDFCDQLAEEYTRLASPPQQEAPAPTPARTRESGQQVRTQGRLDAFQRLKAEHPDWTQDQVADAYSRETENDYVTGETVRKAYRDAGMQWPRGKRRR
jgi:hypothetical protein